MDRSTTPWWRRDKSMLDLIEGLEPSPDPAPARSRAPTKATDKARAMRQPPAVQARAIRPSGGFSPGPTARRWIAKVTNNGNAFWDRVAELQRPKQRKQRRDDGQSRLALFIPSSLVISAISTRRYKLSYNRTNTPTVQAQPVVRSMGAVPTRRALPWSCRGSGTLVLGEHPPMRIGCRVMDADCNDG